MPIPKILILVGLVGAAQALEYKPIRHWWTPPPHAIHKPILPVVPLIPGPRPKAKICSRKKNCAQMRSCAEAKYHYKVCGKGYLDLNKDGIPCAKLCKH